MEDTPNASPRKKMVNPIFIPFALAGGFLEGAGTVLMRKVLKRNKINFKSYQVFEFLAIVLVMVPFIWFFWRMDATALELKNILIFAVIIIISVLANLFVLYAFKREKLTELEPMRLFQPLFVIILAIIIYPLERGISKGILVAAFVAALALIFSHIKKHHLKFNKYTIAVLIGSFFFALELAISHSILQYYSPLSFYFIRSLFVFIISYTLFRPKINSINKKVWTHIFIIGAIWVAYRILLYYGFVAYGVIFTTLLFIVSPVFIYIFAAIFLKEKVTWRNIIATIVILASVAYAISVA